jgi:hypothetical protein
MNYKLEGWVQFGAGTGISSERMQDSASLPGPFLIYKMQRFLTDHSPPYISEVKNQWNSSSAYTYISWGIDMVVSCIEKCSFFVPSFPSDTGISLSHCFLQNFVGLHCVASNTPYYDLRVSHTTYICPAI